MIGWLGAKALFGITRGLWLLIAVFGAIMLALLISSREEADDRRNREVGRTIEREEATRSVLRNVEEGNAVRTTIERQIDRGTGGELYAVCMRSARAPENCVRFLPQRPAD